MNQSTTGPVQINERAEILDALRGFALLGICMANFAVFSLYVFLTPDTRDAIATATIDKWLAYFHFACIDGKFYSLFSLLFGIGFSIILQRRQKTSTNTLPLFYRRLFFLAMIGLSHALLLWEGDILFLYALLGLILPLFRKCSDRMLLILWVCLILSPILFDLVKVVTDGKWNMARPLADLALAIDAKNGLTDTNFGNWLVVHEDYASIRKWTSGGFFWRWEGLINSNRLPKVLGMFLLGLYVGRHMMYIQLEANKPLLKKVKRWGFLIGIPASIAFAYFEKDHKGLPKPIGLADTVSYALSVVPLSLAYTASFCLAWLNPVWKQRLQVLAPAGRMALTNYLMQTVAGIFIFWGVGFGLGTTMGPTGFLLIAIGVYVLQVVLSNIWFRYFQYGPVEWLWRMLTYGTYLPIKK